MLGVPQVDLNHLTEEERDMIQNVLKRDEELQHKDQDRVNVLRNDIRQIKLKGTLKDGQGDADKTCSRCRKPFGWIFDKGEICPKCKHKVCEDCQVPMEKGSTKWNCTLCQKQRELDAMSGQWFYAKFRKSKRNRKSNRVVTGTEIVRQSFKRSHRHMNGSPPSLASDEVKRSLNGSTRPRVASIEGESSDTQSAKDMNVRRHKKVTEINDAAFPKDAEKIMLLDLLGGPSVGPGLRIGSASSDPESPGSNTHPGGGPIEAQVEVRRINARRYSSSSDDRDSAPSSPQMSHRTESEYAPSDSIRSSFRSTSAISSDGRITLVTDVNSGMSDFSTAPPSMQNSPALSNTSSIEQSHQHFMHVTSEDYHYSPHASRKSPTPKPRTTVHSTQKSAQSTSSSYEPKKSDSKSSADSAIENPSHFSSQMDSTSSLSEDTIHVQTVKVVSHARSASSSSSNEDLSTQEAFVDMTRQSHASSSQSASSASHHNNNNNKRQAPPPPKPVRSRNVSSGSDAERFKSEPELDYNERKDGAESTTDSASTLTGGDVTGEYDVTTGNDITAAMNGHAEGAPNTSEPANLTSTGSSNQQRVTTCVPLAEISEHKPIPAARAKANALLAKHGRSIEQSDTVHNTLHARDYYANRVLDDLRDDSAYVDPNHNETVNSKHDFTPRSNLKNVSAISRDYDIIDTPPPPKKHIRFSDEYEIIYTTASEDEDDDTEDDEEEEEDDEDSNEEEHHSDSHDSFEIGPQSESHDVNLSASMESLEWDREIQEPTRQSLDPSIETQLKTVLALHGVGVDPTLKIHSQSETSFQWANHSTDAVSIDPDIDQRRKQMKDDSIEDAYFLEVDVDSLHVSGRNPDQSELRVHLPEESEDEFSDSLSVIAELTEPEETDHETNKRKNSSSSEVEFPLPTPEHDSTDACKIATIGGKGTKGHKSKFHKPDNELKRLFFANKTESVDADTDLDLSQYLESNIVAKGSATLSSQPLNVERENNNKYDTTLTAKPVVESESEIKPARVVTVQSVNASTDVAKSKQKPVLEKQDTLQKMVTEAQSLPRKESIDFDAMFEMNKSCLEKDVIEEIMQSYSPALSAKETPVESPITPRRLTSVKQAPFGFRELGDNTSMPSPTISSSDEGYDSLRIKDPDFRIRGDPDVRSRKTQEPEFVKMKQNLRHQKTSPKMDSSMNASPNKPKRTKFPSNGFDDKRSVDASREPWRKERKERDGGPVDSSHTKSVQDLQSLFNSKTHLMKPRVLSASPCPSDDERTPWKTEQHTESVSSEPDMSMDKSLDTTAPVNNRTETLIASESTKVHKNLFEKQVHSTPTYESQQMHLSKPEPISVNSVFESEARESHETKETISPILAHQSHATYPEISVTLEGDKEISKIAEVSSPIDHQPDVTKIESETETAENSELSVEDLPADVMKLIKNSVDLSDSICHSEESESETEEGQEEAPYLAREGARNSLERQRTVESTDSMGRHSRSSSRAMTEAERTQQQPNMTSSANTTTSTAMTRQQKAASMSMSTLALSTPASTTRDGDDVSMEAEDIDELVASHRAKSMGNLHNPHRSNLLSPFSASVESVTSFYSDAGEGNYGKIPVSGEIQFGLDYNYKTGTFEVRIKQCKDIACVDAKKKRSDPYVKTYLLPDRTKSGKRKTRVKKHTTNPVFNELIKYHIGKSELETRTLWVTVWHNDTFGRNDFLGEVTIPLDYYEFKEPAPQWYKLQERNPTPMSLLTYKGDVSMQLKYVSAENVSASRKTKSRSGVRGELHVMVKQARNLTAVRANGSSDPFCKAYLLPEKGKTTKQKTPVIKKNCNPQWKHTFIFEDISGEDLRERALDLTIWDHDRFTSNDFLGGARLSLGTGKSYGKDAEWCDSKGEEISLWQGMLDRPNTWVEGTLLLRPNMDSRKKAA